MDGRRTFTWQTLMLVVIGVSLGIHPASGADEAAVPTAEQAEFFEKEVRPLLLDQCAKCHGADQQKGGLRLDNRLGAVTGGDSGPAIVAGDPSGSLLIDAINYNSFEMPPDGKLEPAQIAILTKWVRMGAPWPQRDEEDDSTPRRGKTITEEDRNYWCFQPVQRVTPPSVDDAWCRNEIDRFVLARLRAEGLTPAPEADKRTLIRRATFDLHGLPPRPEDVDAFFADDSPEAFSRLVDRLLESPRYGEHWARHWLDLVRYAESDGFKQDAYRPQVWRYRDYVIQSLNDDQPYDRFVIEQLAGDELDPNDPKMMVATSFLRHWIYEYNQRDVRTQWNNILNDITDVTSDVFLGLGMGCARCHDHKFDPILQRDYFRLQAFFAPLLPRDDLLLLPPAELTAYQQKLMDWEKATESIRREMETLERPVKTRVAQGAINKFPPDIRPMLAKPAEERTPFETQIFELADRQVREELNNLKIEEKLTGEEKERWKELREQLRQFDSLKPASPDAAFTVRDVGPKAPETKIPGKGKSDAIAPGYLTVLDPSDATLVPAATSQTTGRRLTLARWIANPQNPLSTRVIANRVWQYHFGRGLASSSSDFGRLGERPTHPQLLDWLADQVVQGNWSLKRMHRLVMNSATYRQATSTPQFELAMRKDPENRLLWHMAARRLDAEQIRDAMLGVSGELDLQMGGPSQEHDSARRTVYTKVLRNRRDPLLDAFDAPDGFNSTAQRNATTTPTQSLLMINGPWTLTRSQAFAQRLLGLPVDSLEARLQAAFRLAYGRPSDSAELSAAVEFVRHQQQRALEDLRRDDPTAPPVGGRPGKAVRIESAQRSPPRLQVRNKTMLPPGDFTIEAFVLLNSLYDDAAVRTIASQWDGNSQHAGWSLGVSSRQSAHKPANLILQLSRGGNESGYEVVASQIFLELKRPYYVSASVHTNGQEPPRVRFSVQELGSGQPLQTTEVVGKQPGTVVPQEVFTIGGRAGDTRHQWDGLIDDVRLSQSALSKEQLLITRDEAGEETVGWWRFDNSPGWNLDSSLRANHVEPTGQLASPHDSALLTALADFCHVLLNSNEFLYVD